MVGVALADSIMQRWPDPDTITPKQWEYTNGIVLYGITKIYEQTGDKTYLHYVQTFVDKYVTANGDIQPIREGHNLDVIEPSNLLFTLYQETKNKKYLLCLEKTAAKYRSFPKNSEGGFWHKSNYPNQMWLDGIYMAEPFIARYGAEYGDSKANVPSKKFCFNVAAYQIKLITKHVFNPKKGLAFHAWDASQTANWAVNRPGGVSPEVWSRGMGWYAMALVDTLEYLPQTHPGYKELNQTLKKVAAGLKKTQDRKTGLWFQVMDKGAPKKTTGPILQGALCSFMP